jgi:hypothetical protein
VKSATGYYNVILWERHSIFYFRYIPEYITRDRRKLLKFSQDRRYPDRDYKTKPIKMCQGETNNTSRKKIVQELKM